MSSLAIPSASATLAPLTVQAHGHGHKKGASLDPTADSSTAAPIPVGSAQNLFGNLFNSLQQLIGAQPVPAAPKPVAADGSAPANSAAAGSPAIGAAVAAGSRIHVTA